MIRLAKGHSFHLGGPWYFSRLPDSGRYHFTKDAGTGTVEVPPSVVPVELRRRVGWPERPENAPRGGE